VFLHSISRGAGAANRGGDITLAAAAWNDEAYAAQQRQEKQEK
jgi:hypothetical protein